MKFAPIIKDFPHFLHGGDYNPDQWLNYPNVIEEDFRLMKKANCNTFSVGIFSWTSYETNEGTFKFDWLDKIMDKMAKNGFNVILATPSAAKPAWMAKKYPEIRRVNRQGIRDFYHTRMNHCWSSPVFRDKVSIINSKLAERYAKHPALKAWHISNEYHGECYCNLCVKSWQNWLKNKYVKLDKINEAWWTAFWSHTYTDWDEIEPGDWLDGMKLDWRRFVNWQICDFMRHEIKPLKKITPNIPVTTNMMGFFETLNYWEIAELCDFIADDSYPDWQGGASEKSTAPHVAMIHDMHRTMKHGKPFMLMESTPGSTNWKKYFQQKAPGFHKLEMLQAIAHGADGICYFQWRKAMGGSEKFHGAVVDHSQREDTIEFKGVQEVGDTIQKLDEINGTSFSPEASIIYDWEIRWAIDASHGPSGNDIKKYLDTIKAHYLPFWKSAVPTDLIESYSSFDKYKVISAPMLFMLKPNVAERLIKFVENGGILVTTYLSGIVDEYNRCLTGGWPGHGLRKLFGIREEIVDGLTPKDKQKVSFLTKNMLGIKGKFNVSDYCSITHLEGAETIATYSKDFYKGYPAVTVNSYGKGYVYYIGARLDEDFHTQFYRAIFAKHKIKSILEKYPPEGVSGHVRTNGKNKYLFLLNFNNKKEKICIPDGGITLPENKKVRKKISLAPYGTAIIKY